MNKTRLISDGEVRRVLSIPALIPKMDEVFAGVSDGGIKNLPRNAAFHPNGNILAVMASSHPAVKLCGCKTAIFPGPDAAHTAQSVVLLFDTESGALRAVVSAEYITVARTAAATAAATARLARQDAKSLCLLGAGTQAIAHAESIRAVRPIEEVRLWSRTAARAEQTGELLRRRYPDWRVEICVEAERAVRGADVVCTVTKAKEPILFGDWLTPGCHVNAVGACGPVFRELDESVLDRAKIFVDSMDTALTMAGDLLIPMKSGRFAEDRILGEMGRCAGRAEHDRNSITLFESCGLAAQDVAAAGAALELAGEGPAFVF